jgi:hypothetical protein
VDGAPGAGDRRALALAPAAAPAGRRAVLRPARSFAASADTLLHDTLMAFDLTIEIENTPGALAQVASAVCDAGVNLAAATCIGSGERAELHILVPHPEAVRHALATVHLGVSREREVVVVDVEDRPGVLADLARRVARAGINLEVVYIATRDRVVFGAADLDALRAALDGAM